MVIHVGVAWQDGGVEHEAADIGLTKVFSAPVAPVPKIGGDCGSSNRRGQGVWVFSHEGAARALEGEGSGVAMAASILSGKARSVAVVIVASVASSVTATAIVGGEIVVVAIIIVITAHAVVIIMWTRCA